VQDLLLDRVVWFLRNADLSKGLARLVEHYRKGIAEVAEALETALPEEAAVERANKVMELAEAGVPETLALRLADLPLLAAAPDIVLVAGRTKKPVADVTATYFAAEAYFRLDRIGAAAREIKTSDYFDRLALDRALDSIGDAERRIAAAMVATGASGEAALDAWIKPRETEITRIRAAVHEIAASGLTISKLSVAASLLGDLAKG
jgi:glutamate dehydrogenase